ncbi:DUF3772 domain-containing protein [Allosediminivita pacifica]|uniref:Small-conductance mechanosensitive channel n=1 Tax=Allosediminivita pacifica TaxID=1267769 RepID=A0A2T6B2D5_9RHOB|nr:DUF3772 domain-containing protein [Allosediminivita pacifica]PTX50247.1 small-conductance mechanosensitive channel [Allosediminivita pacifica]GGB02595.1 mechanosensitive ion channel protein MscS [Allosediminivita pacifica]
MTKALRGLFAALALVLWTGLALAQPQPDPIDYEAWTDLASRAEQAVQEGRASDAALEDLRANVASWRDELLRAQGQNANRIQTLQSQLDTLGQPPENGEEPPEISERRAELETQLAELRAPVQRAEEAHARANGIVEQIDTVIRERQTQELLELGPSPLNPANWPPALTDLTRSLDRSWQEIIRNAEADALRREARENAPLILLYGMIGLMLILRGNHWARTGVERLRGATRRGTGVFRFAISLGQILLPLAGIYAISQAAIGSGIIGPRWTILLEQIPVWATVLLGIRWLADQTFNENDEVATLPLEDGDRKEALAYANILSVLFVARDVLHTLIDLDGYAPQTESVLQFPLVVLTGLMLFRLAQIRNRADAHLGEQDDPNGFRLRLARMIGRACLVIAVVGPVMAAIGYSQVGEALVFPAVSTLALIALVLVLQHFIHSLYFLVAGRDPEEANSLIPVLAGFLLALATIPILALIWGARVADLTEVWARFQEGFTLGERRISPTDFLLVIIVFAIGYVITRLVQGALRTSVLPKTKLDIGGQNAIVSGLGYVGIILAGIIAVTAGGLDLSSLAIVAGALSVGIGFGLQTIVSNFVSGIILLAERPISEGDWIEVNGQHGIVKDIAVRATRIETFDRFDLIVPNADLVSGQVRNYTRGNVLGRVIVKVGVAYGTDTRKVEKILLNIARDHPLVLMNPAPYVYFAGFGDSAMEFQIRAILSDINEILGVETDMYHAIAERFAQEGVEIPFPQRDLWLRNPDTLRPASGADSDTDTGQGRPAGSGQEGRVSQSAGGQRPPGDGDADGDGE